MTPQENEQKNHLLWLLSLGVGLVGAIYYPFHASFLVSVIGEVLLVAVTIASISNLLHAAFRRKYVWFFVILFFPVLGLLAYSTIVSKEFFAGF